jgi:hypothetical protein
VLRCGTGQSLFWELELAVKILRPEQLLLGPRAYRVDTVS